MKKNIVSISIISKKILLAGITLSLLTLQSCGDSGEPKLKDFTEKTIKESTKGVVTEIEEIEPGDEYKIIDEKLIDKKQNSIAIVHKLDGKIDTLSLEKLKKDESFSSRNSGLHSILMFSLAASFFNRNLSNTSPNSGAYKNADAYNKSTGLKNNLNSSAASRTVRVPGKSSSGYGAGKSFRSYGG